MSRRWVLDTNVVLDCWVFDDPRARAVKERIESGAVAMLTHAALVDELQRVLAYPKLRLTADEQTRVLATYRRCASEPGVPDGFSRDSLCVPSNFPRCRDCDDDIFVALAFHARADALVTKDKAVLKLRKRAAAFDVKILDVADAAAFISIERTP